MATKTFVLYTVRDNPNGTTLQIAVTDRDPQRELSKAPSGTLLKFTYCVANVPDGYTGGEWGVGLPPGICSGWEQYFPGGKIVSFEEAERKLGAGNLALSNLRRQNPGAKGVIFKPHGGISPWVEGKTFVI